MVVDNDVGSVSYAQGGSHIKMLDTFASASTMSVYCTCGRIVVLDRSEMKIKLELGKELQCMTCRNARISQEIDSLNNHFNGISEEDGCYW